MSCISGRPNHGQNENFLVVQKVSDDADPTIRIARRAGSDGFF
jgi:hypothetical protein